MKTVDFFVHSSAVVSEKAMIGQGTRIWHFCHIMDYSQIGEHCILGQNVFVGEHVIIGNRVKIQNNVSVYRGVHCEDNVFIGPSVVFTNVINPRGAIERKDEFRNTIISEGASLGANASILCGIRIGEFSMIGAGTVVVKDVPAYAIIIGNPGIQSGWISDSGEKLSFDIQNRAVCSISGDQYQLINSRVKKVLE